MAIKEYIYLLGVEDIEKALDRLKAKGEESLAGFRDLGGAGLGEPFTPISQGANDAASATENLSIKAHDLHSVFFILRPILQAAGFEVGQFAAMGRLASVGIGGIAAAAAGAVLVGLARLEDSARTTRGQLEDLFQSKALSEKAFAGIQASAQQFNTTVSSIVPGVEALKIAWDRFVNETRTFKFVGVTGGDIGQIIPPGMVGSVESLQTAYDNFIKLLRAGRLDQTNATKTAQAFFTAMQNGGKLTADILRTLPVGTINELAQAMGRGSISAEQFINEVKLTPIGIDKLIEALNRFTLESDTAFRDKAIITYRDKIGEIINTLSGLFKSATGTFFSDFIVDELDKLAKGIAKNKEQIEWFKSWIEWIEQKTNIPIPWWMQGTVGNRPAGIPGGGTPAPETGAETNRVWEAAGISAKDAFARGFRQAPAAMQDIAQTVQSDAQQAGQQFGQAYTKALSQIGASPEFQQLQENPPIDPSAWQSAINQIANQFQSLRDQVQQMFSNIQVQFQWQSNPFLAQQPTNLASGGFVRGPGTTTSDSIWAFLSNREYVTRAKAVEYYGLPFMNAINAMRLPKNLFAGHFAGGGLARATASSGRPVTLVIDTHSFDMNASADTVKALSKFSVARQLSATGRKPSWVK